nr:NAD-dependent epimerase/dehydratase family protein [Mesorhizobium sp. M5C.F.Ca.IN.020.29.1.1]
MAAKPAKCWRHGFEPVVYDNLSRGNHWAARFGPFELGDVGDPARVRSVLEKHRPSAVIHFAAYAYVGERSQTVCFIIATISAKPSPCWKP